MRTLRRRYLRRSGPFKPSTKVLCWEPGGELLKVEGLRPSEVQTFQGTFKGTFEGTFKGTFKGDLQRYLQRSQPFEGSLEGCDPSKVPSKVQVPMCKVCTEAVHAVALRTRATLGLDMCKVCTEAVHSVAL